MRRRNLSLIATATLTVAVAACASPGAREPQASNPRAVVSHAAEPGERHLTNIRQLTFGGENAEAYWSADGRRLACTRALMVQPAEVMLLESNGQARNLSQANKALLAEIDLPKPESVTVKGAGGTPMQMWILKPPGFDPAKKWPLVYLVHGGPQGAGVGLGCPRRRRTPGRMAAELHCLRLRRPVT